MTRSRVRYEGEWDAYVASRVSSGLDYQLVEEADSDEGVYFGVNPETGNPICAADSGSPNRYGDHVCLTHPLTGRLRCKMHGGMTPRGAEHHKFQDGRYSLYVNLPSDLVMGFEAARSNPDLMQMDDDIAILVARANQLMGKLNTGESRSAWEAVRAVYDALMEGFLSGDTVTVQVQMRELDLLIRRGMGEAETWEDIIETFEARRKLIETNRRQHESLNQNMPVALVMAMFQRMLAATLAEVTDVNGRRRILQEFNAMFPAIEGKAEVVSVQ